MLAEEFEREEDKKNMWFFNCINGKILSLNSDEVSNIEYLTREDVAKARKKAQSSGGVAPYKNT